MHKEEGECKLKEEEAYVRAVDVDYSFHLAKRMEQYKCCLLYTSDAADD